MISGDWKTEISGVELSIAGLAQKLLLLPLCIYYIINSTSVMVLYFVLCVGKNTNKQQAPDILFKLLSQMSLK